MDLPALCAQDLVLGEDMADLVGMGWMVVAIDNFWLVVWNMFFVHILGIIIPTDELIFFRGVETTNHIYLYNIYIIYNNIYIYIYIYGQFYSWGKPWFSVDFPFNQSNLENSGDFFRNGQISEL